MAWFRATAPCPACDAPLPPELAQRSEASGVTCPACKTTLRPITVARVWRRLAAGLVDMAILAVTAGPLQLLLTRIAPTAGLAPGARGWDAALVIFTMPLGSLLMRAAPFLVMSGLYVFLFSTLTGSTPGQKLLRLRVVDARGEPPPAWRAAVRLLGLGLGLLPAALGPLWAVFDMERRALHDHLAGTWLVLDRKHPTTT